MTVVAIVRNPEAAIAICAWFDDNGHYYQLQAPVEVLIPTLAPSIQ
jgi:hypothetical protein